MHVQVTRVRCQAHSYSCHSLIPHMSPYAHPFPRYVWIYTHIQTRVRSYTIRVRCEYTHTWTHTHVNTSCACHSRSYSTHRGKYTHPRTSLGTCVGMYTHVLTLCAHVGICLSTHQALSYMRTYHTKACVHTPCVRGHSYMCASV